MPSTIRRDSSRSIFGMVQVALLLVLTSTSCLSGRLMAQESHEVKATYGRGVHAYFRGQVFEAERLLTEAIHAGSKDPRVYYFRSMARMKSGRELEAESDMQIGASLEARNPGYGSSIGISLQRVQGPHRRKLEEYRRQARLDLLNERQMLNRNRYQQLELREPKVLRQEFDVPLEELTSPTGRAPADPGPTVSEGETQGPVLDTPKDEDPFGEAEDSSEDPFGPPQQGAGEEEDPFGAEQGDDPFSSPSDDDPFTSSSGPSRSQDQSGLSQEDKVTAGTMAGVLGRAVGKAMPWSGLELPMPPTPALGPPAPEGFGPGMEGDSEFESSEIDSGEDLFGEPEEDPFSDSEEDPFSGSPSITLEALSKELQAEGVRPAGLINLPSPNDKANVALSS